MNSLKKAFNIFPKSFFKSLYRYHFKKFKKKIGEIDFMSFTTPFYESNEIRGNVKK